MSFSIKAIIRAWLSPEHGLSCPTNYWRQIVAELERRGGHRHEAGVFLLGIERNGRREVSGAIFYDELDPHAYDTGACVLHGDAFAKLWALCREKKLTVVADVHTHPGVALQSHSDKENPMVARAGHIAIIIPNFARWPVPADCLGIYQYRGEHIWNDLSPPRSRDFFYIGYWS
jgi:proteasome lid subunit RPN8/RPN11